MKRYLLIPFIVLTITLSGCDNVPKSKIEDFGTLYFAKYKENNIAGMYNMFYEKAGIIYPRYEYAHEKIIEKLGDIKEAKRTRSIECDFSFSGNAYEVIYDIEFEKYRAAYCLKIISRKNELYIVDWYIESKGLERDSAKDAAGNDEKNSGKEAATPGPVNSYPVLPHKELIFPLGRFSPSHAPSIVELPGGGLFAVWYSPAPWGSDAAIWGSSRPADAGEWTAPSLIADTPGLSDKNPVLYMGDDKKLRLFWVVEKRQSKLWLFWILEKSQSKWREVRILTKVSGDFGHTWSEANDLGVPSGLWTRTHPVRLHDGRVILPLYMDWSTSSAIVTSRDGGSTWGRPRYIVYFLGTQPAVIQRSDLNLFALMRSGTWPRRSWQSVSDSLGHSWKNYRISGIKNPGSSLEMVKLHSGNVALIFNDSKTERSNLSLALSCDDGKTWPYVRVMEDKAGYCYPSIIQDSLGLIHAVYSYNEQNSVAHFVADEQWIRRGP